MRPYVHDPCQVAIGGAVSKRKRTQAHHVGKLPQNSARKLCQERLEVETHVALTRDRDQSVRLFQPASLFDLGFVRAEPVHFCRKRFRQVLQRGLEAGERLFERPLRVFGRIEDADDALYAAMGLQFGEKRKRSKRGISRRRDKVEQQRPGG